MKDLKKVALISFIWGIIWGLYMSFTKIGWLISTKFLAIAVTAGNLGLILITWWGNGRDAAIYQLVINTAAGTPVYLRMLWQLAKDNDDLQQRLDYGE